MGCHVILSPCRPNSLRVCTLNGISHIVVFHPSASVSLPSITENLVLMQQTFQTTAELLQISPTDPHFIEKLRHLRSQVSALIVSLSLSGLLFFCKRINSYSKKPKAVIHCIFEKKRHLLEKCLFCFSFLLLDVTVFSLL